MNIHRALSDIAEIRAQLDRTESYRGFRSTAVGVSVIVLIAGAVAEKTLVANPAVEIDRYLWVWFFVAAGCALAAIVEMFVRGRISDNRMVWRLHLSLLARIAPCLFVGFVYTLLISEHAFEQPAGADTLMWTMPGVWSMIYSLGLFACHQHLPEKTGWVAGYLLVAGALVLALNWMTREPAGWQMIATFGVGQAMLAGVLFWNLERRRGETKA